MEEYIVWREIPNNLTTDSTTYIKYREVIISPGGFNAKPTGRIKVVIPVQSATSDAAYYFVDEIKGIDGTS
jgi:hypothetical protein